MMKVDNKEIVEEKFKSLRKAFLSGKSRDFKWRKNQLKQLALGLQEESQEIFAAIKKDLGRDYFSSELCELEALQNEIQHVLRNMDCWLAPQKTDTPLTLAPASSKVVYQPLGVAVIIGTWNFPMIVIFRPLIHAIAAGNCALCKPANLSPHSSVVTRTIIEKYLDNECIQVVEGGAQVSIACTSLKSDLIVFTGSCEKGKLVAEAAAKNLIPCILELGGKNMAIVDEDANTDIAAIKIVGGRFTNAGQICIAPDYVIVHESIKDELVDKLVKRVKHQFTDDPKSSEFFGRLINEANAQRVLNMTKDTGGKIVCGGDGDVKERYVAPTIIVDPKMDSDVMKEEVFGPILPVISFKEFDEVLEHIYEREKPLAMYYFGSSSNPHKDILEKDCQSGGMVVNDTVIHSVNNDLPFGGIGNSGIGKYAGRDGLRQFCNNKSVMIRPIINIDSVNSLVFPPFTESDKRLARMLLRSRMMQSHVQKLGLLILLVIVLFVLWKMGFIF